MKRTIQIGLILILCLLLVASFALLAACDKQPVLQLKSEDNVVRLDLDDGSIQVDIASFFKEKISDIDYRVSTDDAQLTLSAVADGKFTISSQTAGSYTVHVECTGGGNTLLEFDITVNVTGSDVGVTVKKATDSVSVEEIMFPDATTYVRYIIDPSAYFDADASITYSAECRDDGVAFTESAGKIIAECTDFGEKNITLYALEGDQRVASAVITLGVLPKYPTQLTNGDFEHGDYYGWQLTDEEKEAYSLYTNSVDIWNNPNNSTGTQLYGYAQEAFAEADFVSSLFKADGTGVITWKMGGNCTEQLQFKLMMYVEDGDDVEIAKFNNWYFGDKRGSAFIMRSYYYQIDEQYLGKYFYFEVIDNASSGEFAFICLDDIVTYYAEAPDFEGCYVASYLTPPPALTLANATNKVMTETSVPKVEVDLAELFTAPIDSSLKFSATCDSDKVTVSDIENNKFTLTCSVEGSYTVHVVAEYNNIAILRFDIAFDVVAAVQDPTAKSKTATVTADTVFYADGTMEGTVQKDIADLFDAVEAITYSAECADPSVSVNIVNKKIVFKSTTAGNKQVTVNALKFGNVAATVQLTVKVATAPSAQLLNGDFEHGDYYGWQLTDEEKAAYSLYNNSVDIWNNPNNSTGTQLYGYAQEAFANADFVSSLFKADGTGIITWKMGGNCTEQLQFKLMMYVEGGENVEIAKFNNWYFGAYKGSAFIMRSYYYQIDKQYLGRYFYFEVIDNASSGEFAFICLDDIVTYYAAAPDFEGCYVASYLTPPPTLTLVNETNNVMTETSVPEVEVDLSELFTAPIDASLKFEASCEDDKVAVSKVTDNKFTLTCSVEGNYTVQVVAKYNNIEIFRFDVAFEVVAAVQDPTAKSDTATVTAETVFYRDGTMEGTAQKDIADLFDAVEAITYSVSCEDQSVSVEIVNKKIVFKSTTSGDKQVTVNALKFGKVAATVQLTVKVAAEPSTQLFNGNFEHGDYFGWQLTEEEKTAYSLYNNSVDIWNNPNNSTGTQLYGYAQEAFANADFVSSLFKADGTGVITWKMGGNCTEQLQFKLMMYVEDGDDVEIAKFNNWYYGAKAGSAFIMRSYYYQIDEQYLGEYFYFEVIDNASSGEFAFICLDDIVTYYAETPALENFYLASYLTPPIVNSEKAIVTAETVFYRDGTMEGIAQKAISDLFNVADDEITFSVNCEDGSVSVEIVDKKIVFKSTTSGDKQVTVNALRSDSVIATVQLTVKVAAEPSTQLLNGNFEHGDYFGWQLTEEEKAAYSLYKNSVDIWNNPNNSTGTQLYGYAQEKFANADFVSSLFKADGTGIITWKMGGNCTEQLQFKLMMYVEDGDDVEIAKFNNWYFGAKAGSAFIMRSYYYQIDEQYLGEYFYFEVIDNASSGQFAFICLDDIVTYYAEAPQFGNDWYKAGYCTDPDQN